MFQARPVLGAIPKQRRPVFGHGINDADYHIHSIDAHGKRHVCPYYKVWANMLERVFSAKVHERRPTYRTCTIDESWKVFSNFKRWMESQDWDGKALDKDILNPGNKHYGPDTCVFISHALNNLLTLRGNARGPYPLGVSQTSMRGFTYFVASCSFYGKQRRLGYFKTVEEAATAYRNAKLGYIRDLAANEPNPRIRGSLLNMC